MMTNDDYQHFVCIVAGENPEKLMEPYDNTKVVEPYVKQYYKHAGKIKEKNINFYEAILKKKKKNNIDKDALREIIIDLKSLTDIEFYEELTKGLVIDAETGNALSTENENGKYSYFQLGKLLSIPFLLKDGREVFQAKKSDIDWDKIHLGGGDVYRRVWEMVMENSAPTTDYEKQLFDNMKDKITYFQKFETKENYVISNTAFWGYAFLSEKTGWVDASYTNDQFVWMAEYYNMFIKNLPDDTLLTIYECKKQISKGETNSTKLKMGSLSVPHFLFTEFYQISPNIALSSKPILSLSSVSAILISFSVPTR